MDEYVEAGDRNVVNVLLNIPVNQSGLCFSQPFNLFIQNTIMFVVWVLIQKLRDSNF